MNENEIQTKVFCSHCDRVTPYFVEWGGEFWCLDSCVGMLPTPDQIEGKVGDTHSEYVAEALASSH